MYKCDLCRDRLAQGLNPHCVDSCPKKAMLIGKRQEIFAKARERASEINGFLYGVDENGGTSTVYVSPVDFEAIDRAILAKAGNPAKAMRMHRPENMLEKQKGWALASIAAPLVGAFAAFVATTGKEGKK